MSSCRCAKCTRREIYKATGMSLSLAWNNRLAGSCATAKLRDSAKLRRRDEPVSQEIPVTKKAS